MKSLMRYPLSLWEELSEAWHRLEPYEVTNLLQGTDDALAFCEGWSTLKRYV